MMQEILAALQSGGSSSAAQLAQRLGVTPAMLAAALEQLERMGRVRRVALAARCAHGCSGCTGGCAAAGPAAVRWELC